MIVDLIQIPMKNFHNDLRLEDNAAKKNREWSCGHMWMFDLLAPPIDTTYHPS